MKGKTNNPNGRPIGATGKASKEIKEWIKTILENNQVQFEEDLKATEPEKRLDVIVKLLPYVIPKQSETKLSLDYERAQNILESMDELSKMFE
jgi:hypothetical protein